MVYGNGLVDPPRFRLQNSPGEAAATQKPINRVNFKILFLFILSKNFFADSQAFTNRNGAKPL